MSLLDKKSLYDLTSRGVEGNTVGVDASAYNRNYPGRVNNRPFTNINVEGDFTFEGSQLMNPDEAGDRSSQLVRLLDQNVLSIRDGDGFVPSPRARGKDSNDFTLDLDLEGPLHSKRSIFK